MDITKRLLIFILAFIVLASPVFVSTVQAQQPDLNNADTGGTDKWYNQSLKSWTNKVYDDSNPEEIFGERYTAAQVQWIMYAIPANAAIMMTGGNDNLVTCMMGNTDDCKNAFEDYIAARNSFEPTNRDQTLLASLVEDRPVSGITYLKHLSLIPSAKAQSAGFGYGGLGIVRDAWRTVRDAAYGFFVIVAIILAFMVMFRIKISPQVVITVQSAIPRLGIAIVLVTFSYAIAGFLVDLMYLVMGLISVAFTKFPLAGFDSLNASEIFGLITKGPAILGSGNGSGVIGLLITYFLNFVITIVASFVLIITNIGSTIGSGNLGAGVGGAVVGVIAILIMLITAVILFFWSIYAIFKITWTLLLAFAQILLYTVFSPIFLLFGAVIPTFSLTRWVRTYASKLAVFPTTGVLYLLSLWLLGLSLQTLLDSIAAIGINLSLGSAAPAEVADFTARYAQGWPPLIGGLPETVGLMLALASVAVLFQIPKAAQLVESLVAGQAFNFGSAIHETTTGAVTKVAGAISTTGAMVKGANTIKEAYERYQETEKEN